MYNKSNHAGQGAIECLVGDSKMKWDGSGRGRRGGVEKEKLLETVKGSWLERKDGVQGYRLMPLPGTPVGVLSLSMAGALSSYLGQGLAKALRRAR